MSLLESITIVGWIGLSKTEMLRTLRAMIFTITPMLPNLEGIRAAAILLRSVNCLQQWGLEEARNSVLLRMQSHSRHLKTAFRKTDKWF